MTLPVITAYYLADFILRFSSISAIIFLVLYFMVSLCNILQIYQEFSVNLSMAMLSFIPLMITVYIISLLLLTGEFILVKTKCIKPQIPDAERKQILTVIIPIITAIIVILLEILSFTYAAKPYSSPKDYEKALKTIDYGKIGHFPKQIPDEASEIQLYSYTRGIGGESLILKFKADNEYIKQELGKSKFTQNTKPAFLPSDNGRIIFDNYKFYPLEQNISASTSQILYFSGIAVDKDMSHILYYYYEPAD